MYNFIRKKYYFDAKTSNYKQKDNKESVILLILEIYLKGAFVRVFSEKKILINRFNKIMNLEQFCFFQHCAKYMKIWSFLQSCSSDTQEFLYSQAKLGEGEL